MHVRMNASTHVDASTHTCTHARTFMNACICTHVYACTHARKHARICRHAHVRTHAHARTHTHTCTYARTYPPPRYGHETFRLVQQVVDRLVEFDQAYTDAGDKIKQLASDCHLHLKTNYRDHVQTASQVGHHCLGHMFSTDDTDHRCPPSCNNHTKHCPECDMPERLVAELTRLYEVVEPRVEDPEERLDLEHEIKTIAQNIPIYVGHLARGYHETNNKAKILESLCPDEFVEVSDWKMKWLMLLMRETQVEP